MCWKFDSISEIFSNLQDSVIEITKTIIPANTHTGEALGLGWTCCLALICEPAGLEVHQYKENSYIDEVNFYIPILVQTFQCFYWKWESLKLSLAFQRSYLATALGEIYSLFPISSFFWGTCSTWRKCLLQVFNPIKQDWKLCDLQLRLVWN